MSAQHPEPHVRIVSGLAVSCAGVIWRAVINESAKTVKIIQEGEPLNGDSEAISAAWVMLYERIERFLPELRFVEES